MSRAPSPTTYLNAQNQQPDLPASTDVLVVGGGIHSLIYAIHARKHTPTTSVTVLERSLTPSYKIGESTLSPFGLWLKTLGIGPHILWRIFGPKDGLSFFYLTPGATTAERDTSFFANGPPGDLVPTLQVERKVSELLLTLIAQRAGVTVLHGMGVDIDGTAATLCARGGVAKVKNVESGAESQIATQLVVDASGRFRRFAAKRARLRRFEGWNTDSFWGYFETTADEDQIPFEHYMSCNTNHICLREGCIP